MKACLIFAATLLAATMVANPANAQGVFKIEKGEAFNKVVPKDFVLEENAIPNEKRNSAVVMTPSGGRLIIGLLDTSGYSSQVQEKYLGMFIAEGGVDILGHHVATGSYGFGLTKSAGTTGEHPSRFILYNQAGKKVMECRARWDAKIEHPRPLEVLIKGRGTARLYLGRTWVALK